MEARRTRVVVSFDGVDISDTVNEYLLSLTYTDNEEDEADDLQIKLEDRAWQWVQFWLGNMIDGLRTSAKGTKILASIETTDDEGNLVITDCGELELDSIKASGPPSQITIKGTSLGYSGIRKTQRDKSWDNYTLKGIQREIAKKYGLKVMYDCGSDPRYSHLEQSKQTDIAFLKKLCQDAGFSLKIANGTIIIFDQRRYEAQQAVSEITFGTSEYIKWNFSTGTADVQYKSCVVRWTDPKTGKKIEGTAYADDKEPSKSSSIKDNEILKITTQRVESRAEAERLASQLLRLHNKMERVASFTVIGNPIYCAGMTVRVKEAGYWSGKYIIKSSKHTVSSSGYTTTVTLRKADDDATAKDEYNVGDVVYFKGGYHYVSSDAKKTNAGYRRPGLAIVTHKTKLTRPHPYGLQGGYYNHLDGDCNVHGWVDADSFS